MVVITGSYLSNLAYCEYKAVLSQEYPTRSVKPQSRRVLEKVVGSMKGVDARLEVVYGNVDGVDLAIFPGAVLYRQGRVYGILRASIRSYPRIYESDFTPIKVSALLLDMQGKVGEILKLAVVASINERLLEEALANTILSGLKPGMGEGWAVSTRIYSREEAERILSRAVKVARSVSLAKPSPSQAKCGACEYARYCEYSMVAGRDRLSA
ncbi:MAG: hypothetical protein F7C08_00390 [Desulfurococcales archaeon]|nr:hypothetical protein [Desulfurococcales archaeon]MCE4604986.1 hypothetical protein [Desulfurococcales archaeon]